MNDREDLELTARQVRAMMESSTRPPLLIDCREESEWRTARIEGARLVPLAELAARAEHIAAEAEQQNQMVIVHCHHGVRSLRGALMLRAHGVDARSMAGGIEAWSKEVDPSVPRY